MSQEESRDMQLRKDGRYTETFTCRCAALVAKPLIMDKPVYCLNFSFLKLLASSFGVKAQTLFVTSRQPLDAVKYTRTW